MISDSKRKIPLITVVVITYNHVCYIRQLIDSIVSQNIDFNVEIIVGDDASSDGTSDEIAALSKSCERLRNIDLIAVKRPENLGMTQNFIKTLALARGKFIAFAEGDDVWIDDNKLQKQLRIMKKGFSVSISDCAVISEKGCRIGGFSRHRRAIDGKDSGEILADDLIASPLRSWHLSSAMIDRRKITNDLTWLIGYPIFDYGFFALVVNDSRVHYSSEEYVSYRKHTESVTAGRSFSLQYLVEMDRMLRQLATLIPGRKRAIRNKRISNVYFWLNSLLPRKNVVGALMSIVVLLPLNKWSPYTVRDEIHRVKKVWFSVGRG